jgi:hypothetical protein
MIYLEDLRTTPVLQNTMEHRMGSSAGRDVELVGGPVAAGSRGLCSQPSRENRLQCFGISALSVQFASFVMLFWSDKRARSAACSPA